MSGVLKAPRSRARRPGGPRPTERNISRLCVLSTAAQEKLRLLKEPQEVRLEAAKAEALRAMDELKQAVGDKTQVSASPCDAMAAFLSVRRRNGSLRRMQSRAGRVRKSMQKINNPILASGSLPNDYQQGLYLKVTEKRSRVITLNILAVPLFVIFGVIFSSLAVSLGKLPSEGEFKFGLSDISLVFVGVLLTFVLHELTHGLFMRIFGARPKYGILWKGMMFYATSPGYTYRRNNYVVIALAPFVVISILIVLGMWLLQGTLWVALLGICGVINASGAIGDMWMTMIVLRYATTAYVMDERDGIRVFLPKP
jgi:hypothetical protein